MNYILSRGDIENGMGAILFEVPMIFITQNYDQSPNYHIGESVYEFLDHYIPEQDGEYLYKVAKDINAIEADFGIQVF